MRWWWFLIKLLIRVGGAALWQFRCTGAERVPRTGGVLLAANHQSYLDPPFVASCLLREMHFMARKSLFRNPVFGALIGRCNAFSIDRDAADVKGVREAIERLRAGDILLVFPEGTRTRNGTIGRMKAGIGLLAGRAAVPIVPVLIEGAREVWPKGAPLPRLGGPVRVSFGEPFRRGSLSETSLGERLREALLGMKGEKKGCPTGSS